MYTRDDKKETICLKLPKGYFNFPILIIDEEGNF